MRRLNGLSALLIRQIGINIWIQGSCTREFSSLLCLQESTKIFVHRVVKQLLRFGNGLGDGGFLLLYDVYLVGKGLLKGERWKGDWQIIN